MSFLALWSAAHPSLRAYLSGGSTRDVYVLQRCPDIVFKVRAQYCTEQAFLKQQRNEWRTWEYACEHGLSHFLAPCLEHTPDFSVIVQARTIEFNPFCDQYPEVPHWLGTDMHANNIGRFAGRIVLHDYGYQTKHSLPIAPIELEACR